MGKKQKTEQNDEVPLGLSDYYDHTKKDPFEESTNVFEDEDTQLNSYISNPNGESNQDSESGDEDNENDDGGEASDEDEFDEPQKSTFTDAMQQILNETNKVIE